MTDGITIKQRSAYFRAFGDACRELGLATGEEREEYRHRVMMEEVGKASIKDLDRTGDFDKVMARFCLDAGQLSAAAAYGIGDDRRVARLAEVCCCQCAQLLGTDMPYASRYIAGILRQMGYEVVGEGPEYWLDISWRSLFAVFKALDTYRRRLIRRHGLAPGSVMAFNVRASYRIDPVTSLVMVDTASPPPAVFKVGKPA